MTSLRWLLDLEPEMWREILPQLFWVCWSSVYHSVATSWQASRHSVLIYSCLCFFYYYTCISVLRLRTHWLVFLSALTVSCCSYSAFCSVAVNCCDNRLINGNEQLLNGDARSWCLERDFLTAGSSDLTQSALHPRWALMWFFHLKWYFFVRKLKMVIHFGREQNWSKMTK